jgi:hypothetical protein
VISNIQRYNQGGGTGVKTLLISISINTEGNWNETPPPPQSLLLVKMSCYFRKQEMAKLKNY